MDRSEVIPNAAQSPAVGLLCHLENQGCVIWFMDTDTLRVGPLDRLTAEQVVALQQYKDQLKALVRVCDEGVQDRRHAFVRQLETAPGGTVPRFHFRPSVPYQAGRCHSCGDSLDQQVFGRCWRCALAWRLAFRVPIPAETARTRVA